MEPMTGYELLQKVRSDSAHTHVPFIMVTVESKTDNVIAARKAASTITSSSPSTRLC
jgi:two-component system, chemotaxis family, chemotaxis protein CheY